jgi:ABC-2 type transport system permease protein/lipopolysaccharide transport system permease protein
VVHRDIRELGQFWPVLQNMVTQELRIRYHRSVLGFLWTLINPILMMATLTMVFSQLWDTGDWKQYAIYLFAGQVPWTMFAGCLNDGSTCIVNNENLIRKIYLPKLIFPLAKVLLNLTTFVLSLVALYFLVFLLGPRFSPAMLMLPVVIAMFATFALGLSLILAVTNTFYRDTGHLVGVVLQAFPFIRMFQMIIRDGHWPTMTLFLAAAGIASVSLGIGYVTFKAHENKLVYRL